jgi:HEAT repeat protein
LDFPFRTVFGPVGWIFLVLLLANVILFFVIVGLREHWVFYERRRAKIRERIGPVIHRLVEGRDREDTTAELKRLVASLDRTGRPVAAWLLRERTRTADAETRDRVREILDECGAIELAEQGTRRWMPWRRALACEMLGTIGADRSVPVLVERLADKRSEVRAAAVRALGTIGSPAAAPALTNVFLERTAVPTGVAYDALRGLGPAGADAFSQGLERSDPTVRVASCFGIAALADGDGDAAVARLARTAADDDNIRVRTAATKALGVIGGTTPPSVLVQAAGDGELRIRRAAVVALGSFDDAESVRTLAETVGDADREIALSSAESLFVLRDSPRASAAAHAVSSDAWSLDYTHRVREVGG